MEDFLKINTNLSSSTLFRPELFTGGEPITHILGFNYLLMDHIEYKKIRKRNLLFFALSLKIIKILTFGSLRSPANDISSNFH